MQIRLLAQSAGCAKAPRVGIRFLDKLVHCGRYLLDWQADIAETADPLTLGLNFSAFKYKAQELFRRDPHSNYVLFYSDISNFKNINDIYGFSVGDEILRRYHDSFALENKVLYARVNADHFVTLERYTDKASLRVACLDRLERMSLLSVPLTGGVPLRLCAGAFCTDGDNVSLSVEAMIDRARIAQRLLKDAGKSGFLIYKEQYRQTRLEEQRMTDRMVEALRLGEFVVHLQPKFNIRSEQIVSAEALVRWRDPELGLISPMRFIPLFERNGFIKELDTYMFHQVCRLISRWRAERRPFLPVSVNVSKAQLNNPQFVRDYVALKNRHQVPNGALEIEFTESMFYLDIERMARVLMTFKEQGMLSSIDDFGAGYSSLNLLKDLPADTLKFDKVFFGKPCHNDRERVVIRNVIRMAMELSMHTVAEGVEHRAEVDFLREVGCELVQGYVFDRPLSVEDFEEKYLSFS